MNKNEIPVFYNPWISADIVFTGLLLIPINFLSPEASSFKQALTSE
jgi:hypothetical protein